MLWLAGKKKGNFLFPDHQRFSWSALMAQLCSTAGKRVEAGVKGLILSNAEVLKMTIAALFLITGWDF